MCVCMSVSVCVCVCAQCVYVCVHSVFVRVFGCVCTVCMCVYICFRVRVCAHRVATPEDVLVLLQVGGSNRAIRGTDANLASSRSHAMLSLSVEVENVQEGGSTVIRRAKLNLVMPWGVHCLWFRSCCVVCTCVCVCVCVCESQ